MRDHRKLAVFVVTALLFVPLVVFGAPALATSVHSSSAQYEYGTTKVTICHHTGSAAHPWVKITISVAGWLNGHHKHHTSDFLIASNGSCPSAGVAPAATTTTTTSSPGKSGEHHGKP